MQYVTFDVHFVILIHIDLVLCHPYYSAKYLLTETQTDLLTDLQREKLMDFCASPTKRNLRHKEGN